MAVIFQGEALVVAEALSADCSYTGSTISSALSSADILSLKHLCTDYFLKDRIYHSYIGKWKQRVISLRISQVSFQTCDFSQSLFGICICSAQMALQATKKYTSKQISYPNEINHQQREKGCRTEINWISRLSLENTMKQFRHPVPCNDQICLFFCSTYDGLVVYEEVPFTSVKFSTKHSIQISISPPFFGHEIFWIYKDLGKFLMKV